MRTAHWVLNNASGMRRTAEAICIAEKALGIDSILLLDSPTSPEDVDIHVVHTHVPDAVLHSGKPLVWFAHGTPEVMFTKGYEEGLVSGVYGHGDSWMMAQFWLQRADAIVTFWPRHQRIWKSLCDKRTIVDCIPMGIDLSFWHPVESSGKFAGTPAVFSAENCYMMKWPLDLLIAWPCPGRRPTKAVLKAMEAGATPQEAVYKVLLAKGEGRINGPQSSGEW